MTPAENSAATQALADAGLFARDALRAARDVMSGNPAGPEGEAYLAVYVLLAAGALGQDRPHRDRDVGLSDPVGVNPRAPDFRQPSGGMVSESL